MAARKPALLLGAGDGIGSPYAVPIFSHLLRDISQLKICSEDT